MRRSVKEYEDLKIGDIMYFLGRNTDCIYESKVTEIAIFKKCFSGKVTDVIVFMEGCWVGLYRDRCYHSREELLKKLTESYWTFIH